MARSAASTLMCALVLLAGCAANDDAAPSPEPTSSAAPEEAVLAFTAEGTLTGAGNTGPASPQGCDTLQQEGMDVMHHPWEIAGEVNGTEAEVVSITVTLTLVDQTLVDADIYLESPDGDVLAESVAFNPLVGPSETVLVEGGLDPGTYTVVVRACAGSGAYSLEGEALLRTSPPDEATMGNATASATASSTMSG